MAEPLACDGNPRDPRVLEHDSRAQGALQKPLGPVTLCSRLLGGCTLSRSEPSGNLSSVLASRAAVSLAREAVLDRDCSEFRCGKCHISGSTLRRLEEAM